MFTCLVYRYVRVCVFVSVYVCTCVDLTARSAPPSSPSPAARRSVFVTDCFVNPSGKQPSLTYYVYTGGGAKDPQFTPALVSEGFTL